MTDTLCYVYLWSFQSICLDITMLCFPCKSLFPWMRCSALLTFSMVWWSKCCHSLLTNINGPFIWSMTPLKVNERLCSIKNLTTTNLANRKQHVYISHITLTLFSTLDQISSIIKRSHCFVSQPIIHELHYAAETPLISLTAWGDDQENCAWPIWGNRFVKRKKTIQKIILYLLRNSRVTCAQS